MDARAAASSVWKGWGSNSRAKATISSLVIVRAPPSITSPTLKSSR
jgi:hypothetical protein